jgi:GH25 family lysozyme M1 (1,4-beta-N-acetylmuramidase)
MTVFFPDLSNWESTLGIQPGTAAVVAKATEGTYYRDASFFRFKDECSRLGITFSGYHFLIQGIDPVAQANAYHVYAGDVPCMLDVETTGSSKPGVDEVVAFIDALKAAGGRCWGVYFPQWYWNQVGGDLGRLGASGAALVASNYTTYSDSGPGWKAYGGATPRVWQYTNSQSYGGSPCDFNAFKGTADELKALIYGDPMDLATPLTFSPAVVQQFPELASQGFNGSASLGTVLGWMAARIAHLVNEVEAAKASAGADASAVADAVLAELKAKL